MCMLCTSIYKETEAELPNNNMNISYGYCPQCFDILMEDFDEKLPKTKEDDEDVPEM